MNRLLFESIYNFDALSFLGLIFSEATTLAVMTTAINISDHAMGILYTSTNSIFAPTNTNTTANP
jgi:hypothetical protein